MSSHTREPGFETSVALATLPYLYSYTSHINYSSICLVSIFFFSIVSHLLFLFFVVFFKILVGCLFGCLITSFLHWSKLDCIILFCSTLTLIDFLHLLVTILWFLVKFCIVYPLVNGSILIINILVNITFSSIHFLI